MANCSKLFQLTLIAELASAINRRLADEKKPSISPSAEDVFKNLTWLYEEKKELEFARETGRSYKFMPKKYKAMVMRLIAPNYSISTKIQTSDVGVTAEAYLFLTPESAKPIAQGRQFLPYDKAPDNLETDAERRAYIEAAAKGLAHSKAYQEFGIGSWYSYQYEPEDNPDMVVSTLKEQDKLNPVVSYSDSGSSKTDFCPQAYGTAPSFSLSDDSDSPVCGSEIHTSENTTEAEIPDSNITPTQKPVCDQPEPPHTATAISLEEARNHPAPVGKAKSQGLTLGETADKYPANIFWMYKQPDLSEYDRSAILAIAAGTSTVREIFLQHGMDI